jgi:RNA polymerase primary sigma factor
MSSKEVQPTPYSLDGYNLYKRDVGRYPTLTEEEIIFYAQTMESGNVAQAQLTAWSEAGMEPMPDELDEALRCAREGNDARTQLILGNLRLVTKIAWRYATPAVSVMDLIQEGNLGLARAVDKFDWRLGSKFSDYAKWEIRSAVLNAREKARLVQIPRTIAENRKKVLAAQRHFEALYNRQPDRIELADWASLTEADIDEVTDAYRDLLWLDAPISNSGDGAVWHDFVRERNSDTTENFDTLRRTETALAVLTDRELDIVCSFFAIHGGSNQTLMEIGDRHNLKVQATYQVKARAIKKMQRAVMAQASGE